MELLDRRKNPRLNLKFSVKFHSRLGSDLTVDDTTENVSQCGAFITLRNWSSLIPYTSVVLTFYLPPNFTGQNKTIALRGDAVITRIDQENEGIAVEFIKTFKEFERIDVPELHGE